MCMWYILFCFLLKVFCCVYVVHIVLFSIKGFLLCVCGTYSSVFY